MVLVHVVDTTCTEANVIGRKQVKIKKEITKLCGRNNSIHFETCRFSSFSENK